MNRDRVFAFQFQGYWRDIGTQEAYYSANMDLLGQPPGINLCSRWKILNGIPDLASIKLTNQGNITNSLISPGCIVRGKVENSILSPGVLVAEQAIVKDSILMSGSTIDRFSLVEGCILDEHVAIGKNCYIGFGVHAHNGRHNFTVLGKESTVPNRTAVGTNCTINPFVKPSDFKSR